VVAVPVNPQLAAPATPRQAAAPRPDPGSAGSYRDQAGNRVSSQIELVFVAANTLIAPNLSITYS
jgi:hypothetical protein